MLAGLHARAREGTSFAEHNRAVSARDVALQKILQADQQPAATIKRNR